MVYQSLTDLKNIARDKMLGHYGTAIGAFLFMRGLIFAGLMISTYCAGQNTFLSLFASFAFILVEGIFVYGELAIYLKISVGMMPAVADVFSAFRQSGDKAIKARMVYVFITYGGIILAAAITYVLNGIGIANPLIGLIWLAIGVVCIYLLVIYSQVMYFMQDFSDINVLEACRRSRNLMKGNVLSFIWLYVSFIPLYIIGVLSIIGLYFIHPYMKLTLTEFYLDRVRQTQTKGFDVSV